jgi:PIN domain nuclease of toxin-antitoxin system
MMSIGKLRLDPTAAEWFERHTAQSRFAALAIDRKHLMGLAELPSQHRDPFDRLLIAQARVENLTLHASAAPARPRVSAIQVPTV